jgi:hypothetical protein
MRVRFATLAGKVVTFTVQYETTIADVRVPVVRYDNAHGFPHRDELNRRGLIRRKTEMAGNPDAGTALTIGQRDIQENWQRYRRAFQEEESWVSPTTSTPSKLS